MNGRAFEISPSINYNIVTQKEQSLSIVDLKFGFRSRLNNNSEKQALQYSKYYYFDKNGQSSSETGSSML